MPKVRRRGGFSDRNNIKPEQNEIQYKEFDERTRIALGNGINKLYSIIYQGYNWSNDEVQNFFKFVLSEVYYEYVEAENLLFNEKFFDIIANTIKNDDYDDVLTLVEAIAQYWGEYFKPQPYEPEHEINIFDFFNSILEKEFAGYRFVGDQIVRITDENEIESINFAMDSPYGIVNSHIEKAVNLLGDRDKPDYENSIKESISAVEALCEIITGLKGKEATLGNMLKKIEEGGIEIHGALKSAFNILYGYTSDANGIRHAGDIGGPSTTFEEAKFMLVSCSAFINYLIGVSAK